MWLAASCVHEFCFSSILRELDRPAAALGRPLCSAHLRGQAHLSRTRCCDASGSLCRSLPHTVAADVARTTHGITSPHALAPEFCARAVPLERAAARVCREAGATVATNVLVRDLNVAPSRQDDRRIEVSANGLGRCTGCVFVFFFLAPFDRRQVRDEGPCATAIYGLRGGFRAAGGVPPSVGKEPDCCGWHDPRVALDGKRRAPA